MLTTARRLTGRCFARRAALTGAVALSLALAAAARAAAPVEGRWLTAKKNGVVEIFHCGDALCGRLLWLRIPAAEQNPEALDLRNPAPEFRRRPLCGLVMMGGFEEGAANEWRGGWIYDPEGGQTYRAAMTLRPDGALGLRGYVGIPLFGVTQVWSRFSAALPRCPSD